MKVTIENLNYKLKKPFCFNGYVFEAIDTVRVTLESGGVKGRGEAVGIYYLNENAQSIIAQLNSVIDQIDNTLNEKKIQALLPRGGARNALDCAFWDLKAKQSGKTIWQQLDINPRPKTTVATIGLGSADEMAEQALRYRDFKQLKIKLDNSDSISRLAAIRAARPDAGMVIDVNQGWTLKMLETLLPELVQLKIDMIEQPIKRGEDFRLEALNSPIPLGADESCLDLEEYFKVCRFYDVINIKLDKCGGLTESLKIAKQALQDGKKLMVGHMGGTSLAMAAASVIAQYCDYVDLDGPLFLKADVEPRIHYMAGGIMSQITPELWG